MRYPTTKRRPAGRIRQSCIAKSAKINFLILLFFFFPFPSSLPISFPPSLHSRNEGIYFGIGCFADPG